MTRIDSKIQYRANSEHPVMFTISDPEIYEKMLEAADSDLEILVTSYEVDQKAKTVKFDMLMVGDYHFQNKYSYDGEELF